MSSISSYVLAGYRRDTLKSSESAMKYFLLGSFATAFFLYGIALVYGVTGTTNLALMGAADSTSNLLKLGLALILIGLGFKVAAAPFQLWTPDVYEGAPTPVTALFSAGPKAATFALLLRIFATVPAATHFWFWAFWILAVLTMFVGNLGALVQTNVKRMLAYSSIAHAGYILVAFAAVTYLEGNSDTGGAAAYAAVLFYLLSYALVKLGAFTIVSQLGGTGEKHLFLDDYAGLGQRQPVVAAALSLFLLSLLGLPVTAGFFGKFYVFKAAVNSHLIWLAVLMAANSIIAAYYYFRLIVVMYMREPSTEVRPSPSRHRLPAPGKRSASGNRRRHRLLRPVPQPGPKLRPPIQPPRPLISTGPPAYPESRRACVGVKTGNPDDAEHQLSLLILAPITTNGYVRSANIMESKPIRNERDHERALRHWKNCGIPRKALSRAMRWEFSSR